MPAGQYSAQSFVPCQVCTAGSTADTAAATAVATAATNCTACAPGRFSLQSTTACADCQAGKYASLSKQTECIDCAAGSTADTDAARAVSAAATKCVACEAGQYSGKSTTQCLGCAAGQYNNQIGSANCIQCAAGQFQGSVGRTSCETCGVRTGFGQEERNEAGEITLDGVAQHELTLRLTTAGKRFDTWLLNGSLPYSIRIYTADETFVSRCGYAGVYTATGADISDQVINGMTYSVAVVSINETLPAPPALYALAYCKLSFPYGARTNTLSLPGATACTLCPPGKAQSTQPWPLNTLPNAPHSGWVTDCVDCPAGQYAPIAGAEHTVGSPGACELCPAGTYMSGDTRGSALKSSCTPCPSGKFTSWDNKARVQCTVCATGQFRIELSELSGEPLGRWKEYIGGQANVYPLGGTQDPIANMPLGNDRTCTCLDKAGNGEWCECRCTLCGALENGNLRCPSSARYPQAKKGFYLGGHIKHYDASLGRKVFGIPDTVAARNVQGDVNECFAADTCAVDTRWHDNHVPNLVVSCQPAEACDGGVGESSCALEYESLRCSACRKGHYRAGDLCIVCPEGWPLWLLVLLFVLTMLAVGVFVDYLFAKVQKLSEKVAPTLILITFFQTVVLLLDVPLDWPKMLRDFVTMLSIFNFNLELAKPECSLGKWNFRAKQALTLGSPIVFIAFVILFMVVLMLKISLMHLLKVSVFRKKYLAEKSRREEAAAPARSRWSGVRSIVAQSDVGMSLSQKLKTKVNALMGKTNSILTTAFVVASVFFLRTIVGGLDCSQNVDSKYYLDTEPQTECSLDDPDYSKIYRNSWIGLGMYFLFSLILLFAMIKGGQERFGFLAEKMKSEWYWWELVLLTRKLAIMVIALRTSEQPEQGWFLCSVVLVVSISAHSYATPYKQDWLNACEFTSLLSTLLLFQAGMVFKVDQDMTESMENRHSLGDVILGDVEADEENTLGPLAQVLVYVAIALILATTLVCFYVEFKLIFSKKGDAYAVKTSPVTQEILESSEVAHNRKILGMQLRQQLRAKNLTKAQVAKVIKEFRLSISSELQEIEETGLQTAAEVAMSAFAGSSSTAAASSGGSGSLLSRLSAATNNVTQSTATNNEDTSAAGRRVTIGNALLRPRQSIPEAQPEPEPDAVVAQAIGPVAERPVTPDSHSSSTVDAYLREDAILAGVKESVVEPDGDDNTGPSPKPDMGEPEPQPELQPELDAQGMSRRYGKMAI